MVVLNTSLKFSENLPVRISSCTPPHPSTATQYSDAPRYPGARARAHTPPPPWDICSQRCSKSWGTSAATIDNTPPYRHQYWTRNQQLHPKCSTLQGWREPTIAHWETDYNYQTLLRQGRPMALGFPSLQLFRHWTTFPIGHRARMIVSLWGPPEHPRRSWVERVSRNKLRMRRQLRRNWLWSTEGFRNSDPGWQWG